MSDLNYETFCRCIYEINAKLDKLRFEVNELRVALARGGQLGPTNTEMKALEERVRRAESGISAITPMHGHGY